MRVLLSIGTLRRSDGGGSVILVMEGEERSSSVHFPLSCTAQISFADGWISCFLSLLSLIRPLKAPGVRGGRRRRGTVRLVPPPLHPSWHSLVFRPLSDSYPLSISSSLSSDCFPPAALFLMFSLNQHFLCLLLIIKLVFTDKTRDKKEWMNEWIKSWFSPSEKWSFSIFFSFPVASPPVAVWLGLACSCSNQDTKPHFTKNQCSFGKQTHLITG